jgi:hypothetical protein
MEEVEIITDKGVCSKVNALIFVLKIALSLKLEFFFPIRHIHTTFIGVAAAIMSFGFLKISE